MAKDEPQKTQTDEDESPPPEAAEPQGSGKVKMLLAGVITLLIIPLASYLIFAVVVAPMWGKAEAEEEPSVKFGKMHDLPALIVNLAESRGTRYLKVKISLEMSKPSLEEELNERSPQISDLLIDVLSTKTITDVSNREGRIRLKREALEKINDLLVTGKVVNVYFVDFVIQ